MNRTVKRLLDYLAIGGATMFLIGVVVGFGAYVWYYKEAFAVMFALVGGLIILGFCIDRGLFGGRFSD